MTGRGWLAVLILTVALLPYVWQSWWTWGLTMLALGIAGGWPGLRGRDRQRWDDAGGIR